LLFSSAVQRALTEPAPPDPDRYLVRAWKPARMSRCGRCGSSRCCSPVVSRPSTPRSPGSGSVRQRDPR